MNVKVSQRESGERGQGKYNIRGNGAGIVETTIRAIGVDDRKTSGGGVAETIRGEEVHSHNITPAERPGQEGNSRQKRAVNIEGHLGLTATVGRRGENRKQVKGG